MPSNFLRRKFLRGFELSVPSCLPPSPSASFSLICEPLPLPPPLSSDPIAAYSINHNPSLFKVISPIHVARFAALLKNHPNPAFVSSVLYGLSHGFWPMASLPSDSVVDHPNHPSCSNHIDPITKFRDKEVTALRYSHAFSTLLPGMKVSPLCVSFKKGSSKARVCTDMSFGSPSLNDLIDKSLVSIPLDSLKTFAPHLISASTSSSPIILWKSDVEGAYRLLPMCPQWQIRQIVRVQNLFYVDRCANFGSSGSAKLWCCFFSLVLWVASDTSKIKSLFAYMDDSWAAAPANALVSFLD